MLNFSRENLYDAHADLILALQTARFARSPVAESHIATQLGTVHVMESKFDESAAHFEADLAIATTQDDKYGQLRAHCNLGSIESTDEPLQLFLRQKKYAGEAGDRRLEALASKYERHALAPLLSSQLTLLIQRGGSRFQDTVNQLTHKRDDVCAKYKALYDTGKLHATVHRHPVDRVVHVPIE
ncbi:hypothetical protein DYB32_001856 [Aphanomyces invadans]|uniref:Uncharacterized protein n=1 Tax=Aphanomyces invadans TaxID=157072 RepID=A0A418B4L0_9STRA|nr:hypothetical protein DYB32_001856 [Aphanomyces invadans]